ncbi:XPA protein C-terminus-domain-containing protein [Poronia punctata]|nr:XPA protein C-terminus-domain-containing protein [Poronia punctata]
MERPSTPPRGIDPSKSKSTTTAASSLTPEVTRRIEENRLKAKAIREQREAAAAAAAATTTTTSSPPTITTRKRTYDSISTKAPSTIRDGRRNDEGSKGKEEEKEKEKEKEGGIRPSRKFTKYVDYDFGKMTDTKGGFLSTEDDPFNKAMMMSGPVSRNNTQGQREGREEGGEEEEKRPKGMTAQEWERLQLLRKLRRTKAGPFEPGMSALQEEKDRKRCRECGNLEIDFVWEEVFSCAVCNPCKERFPERYSLLTKTECREDYLLTDPELRDEDLLPHLSRPNPHKSHWHDMMLFLRYQVEDYAFEKKWGSADALDAEFEKREVEKKRRKEAKFKEKLLDLKKRTRTDAYLRQKGRFERDGGVASAASGKKAKFGDVVADGGKHVHEWGRVVENEEGATVKTCTICGMEVEELEF